MEPRILEAELSRTPAVSEGRWRTGPVIPAAAVEGLQPLE